MDIASFASVYRTYRYHRPTEPPTIYTRFNVAMALPLEGGVHRREGVRLEQGVHPSAPAEGHRANPHPDHNPNLTQS